MTLPTSSDLSAPDLIGSAAVRLFVDRARAAAHDFALTPANTSAVADICRRLDGLPLAIELAATRVRVLPPPALLARLEQSLQLLTGGPHDAPARLRTMRDAIAWSHDMLPPAEQTLFRCLSVFVGGFSLTAAESVAGGNEQAASAAILDGIVSLFDRSLLRQEAGIGDEPRYSLLETIREFGMEQLEAYGEASDVERAHAVHFLALAEAATAHVERPEMAQWLDRLETDLGNFRAALAWSTAHGEVEILVRLAGALWVFFRFRGHFGEGRGWVDQAVSMGNALPANLLALAMMGAGQLAFDQGDLARVRSLCADLFARSRAEGYPLGVLWALSLLGDVALRQGELDAARQYYERARAVVPTARETRVAAMPVGGMALTALRRGDLEEAAALSAEAVALSREAGSPGHIGSMLAILGNVVRAQGDGPRAASIMRESLVLRRELGDTRGVAASLVGLAQVALGAGQAEPAVRLLAASDVLREFYGVAYDHVMREEDVDLATKAARARLGEAAFTAAWAAGRALTAEEAVAEAMAIDPPARSSTGAMPAAATSLGAASVMKPAAYYPVTGFALSPREVEVLRLLAAGRSNREIAAELIMSRRTATTHVTHIFEKLGVGSRAEATAVALRHGLI